MNWRFAIHNHKHNAQWIDEICGICHSAIRQQTFGAEYTIYDTATSRRACDNEP